MNLTLYQTLENRNNEDEVNRDGPFPCNRKNAWLGTGYYFWDAHIDIAHWWGRNSYKDNYYICIAVAKLDDKCWDLLSKQEHREEFYELCQFVSKKENIPPERLKIGNVIEFLKRSKSIPYTSIRVYPTSANGYKLSKTRLKFHNKTEFFLDLQPAVQICLFNKRALSLNGYSIIYPEYSGEYA